MSMSRRSGRADSSHEMYQGRASDAESQRSGTNLSDAERAVSIVVGGGMLLYGLTRSGRQGMLPAAAGGALVYRGVSGWCSLYHALGINTSQRSPQASIGPGEGFRVEKAVTINRPANELYRTWRNLSNLPQLLGHIDSVTEIDERTSRWVVAGPLGMDIEWSAEIIEDKPGEMIAWKSLEDADVATAGSIHFRQRGPSETEVRVNLRYSPPGGSISTAVVNWFSTSPEEQIERDLENFKATLEASRATVD